MGGLNRLEVMTKKYVVTLFQDLILIGVIGNLVDCFMAAYAVRYGLISAHFIFFYYSDVLALHKYIFMCCLARF